MTDLNNLANANAVDPVLEKQVDDLSKPENETELNKVLTDELSQSGDPAQNDPKPQDDDPLKDQTDPSNDDKPVEKADKIKNLLADRNEAREAAAKAELDAQTKEKMIADLKAENERLKSGDKGDEDNSSTDKNKSVDQLVKEAVEKALSQRQQSEAAEKSDIAEVEALKENKSTPNAAEYEKDIRELMIKHPTISAYAAYRMLQGEGVIPKDDASISSNSDKLNTGDQPKHNLVKGVDPSNMTLEEQEAHLKVEASSGRLVL